MPQSSEMMTEKRFPTERTLVEGFTFVDAPSSDSQWLPVADRPNLRSYDLGSLEVSEGKVNTRLLTVRGRGEPDHRWLTQSAQFHFTYVFEGRVTFEFSAEGEAALTLNKGDSIIIPPGKVYREEFSHDYRCLELVAQWPEGGDSAASPLIDPSRTKPLVNRESKDAYIPGLRGCFLYREVGAMEATNNKVSGHIVRVAEVPEGGTGWHCHRGARIGVGIQGWAEVVFDGHKPMLIVRESGNAVPPLLVHNAHRFSEDYMLIEFGFPGVVESIRREPSVSPAA